MFLDLAKAFDTVTHDSIRKVLYRKRVLLEMIEGIICMYRQAKTVIGVGGKFTRRIKINAGVKQGCPLSPLLINSVTNELLERIEQKKIRFKVGDTFINFMAFADDLVLIAEEPVDMKILLQIFEKFFDEKGLSVNERRNRLVNKIGKELKNNFPGSKIQIEHTGRRETELVKPDISVTDEKDSQLCDH